jgi:16S rRNA (cytosine967-C5)-methyltransferase
VTCSVLPAEDDDRVAAFRGRHPQFELRPATDDPTLARWLTPEGFLRLSPRTAATDGFFVAVLERGDDRGPKSG